MAPRFHAGLGAVALAAALSASAARAKIVKAEAGGFEVRQTVQVGAAPAKVYYAFVQPDRWWSPDHTYSRNPANLRLETRPGGCFCETSPDIAVEHMRVVNLEQGRSIRLVGALGPLQSTGGTGHLTAVMAPVKGNDEQTTLILTYVFGGYDKDGMAHWAQPVDGVLAEQTARLKLLIETGKPEAPKL